jgi:hypothetical protein
LPLLRRGGLPLPTGKEFILHHPDFVGYLFYMITVQSSSRNSSFSIVRMHAVR